MGVVSVALLAIGGLAVACGGDGDDDAVVSAMMPPQERTIKVAAYELKGGTQVEKEAFPGGALSGGYALKAPNEDGRWEVEAYAWLPGQIEVNQGDTVTLEIIGINGAEHLSSLENYVDDFVVRRGQMTTVTFVADQAGVFKLLCENHPESMIGELVVRARS
jgi:plastocyanin